MRTKKTDLSLDPIDGPLGFDRAKHLLNRCVFGPRFNEIEALKTMTAAEALDYLMRNPESELSPPIGVRDTDEEVPVGETWVNTPYNGKFRAPRIYSYNAWWIGRLIRQDLSLTEKMALFWHNHFVIENDTVRNTNFNYRYNKLITESALGNFKTLCEDMTVNVGMLTYLNGTQNIAGSPNENYARELFELFTIGKGPLLEEGNYTNYTEHDIREAARVLTGWKTSTANDASYFSISKHDTNDKVFSEIYNGNLISNRGDEEFRELIAMIFGKRETARYLIRKLYRWFVYFQIDDEIEKNIIEPLADVFINSDFEIKPLLATLLSSNHFYDENFRGVMIKNPLEFTIGLLRQIEYKLPDQMNVVEFYGFCNNVRSKVKTQDMDLGNPPDVAGWPAWYLVPNFHKIWINTATIPNRSTAAKALINYGIRPVSEAEKIFYDPFELAYLADDPSDINSLLATCTSLLFPKAASEAKITELKEILIPGLPDFEWTVEWNRYVNNPEDENQKKAVDKSLRNLLTAMCSMPEYQLM